MIVKYEIKAFSLEEAKQKASELGLTIIKNVTYSWNKKNKPQFNTDLFKQFVVDILEKKRLTKTVGVGVIISAEAGLSNVRKKPWVFKNNVVDGKRTTVRKFDVRIKENDFLIGSFDTKHEAVCAAKKAIKNVKKDIYCDIVYHIAEDNMKTAFTLNYTTSPQTKLGTYYVFGKVLK